MSQSSGSPFGWLASGGTVALLAVVVAACGNGARKPKGHPSPTALAAAAAGIEEGKDRVAGPRYQIPGPATAPYLNDGDHDHIGDPDRDNSKDDDADAWLDYQRDDNGLYHDRDDPFFLPFGKRATAAEERTIDALVKRYYAIAASGDGSRAWQRRRARADR